MARSARASLVPGALLAAAGLAWFAQISPGGSSLADVLGPSLVTSVGVGLVLAPVAAAGTTGVAPGEADMVSGLLNSSRRLGGCVCLATLATLAAHRTGTSTAPADLTSGYALSLSAGAALFLLPAVAAFALPRRPARRTPSPVAATEPVSTP